MWGTKAYKLDIAYFIVLVLMTLIDGYFYYQETGEYLYFPNN